MSEGFRFQQLEIWKRSSQLSKILFNLAAELEKKRLYSKMEFATFLNYSRRSVYEVANILLIMHENGYIVINN